VPIAATLSLVFVLVGRAIEAHKSRRNEVSSSSSKREREREKERERERERVRERESRAPTA